LVGLAVAILGIGLPILLELRRQRLRFELSTHYWIEQFAEANHYCGASLQLHGSVDNDLRSVLAGRVSHCLESLAENAQYIEKRLPRPTSERDPSKLFHLMTTELELRVQRDLNWNGALFSYCASSVLTLLLGVKLGRDDAIGILSSVEQQYAATRLKATETGDAPPTQDEKGDTLAALFFHDVIDALLDDKVKARIRAGAPEALVEAVPAAAPA